MYTKSFSGLESYQEFRETGPRRDFEICLGKEITKFNMLELVKKTLIVIIRKNALSPTQVTT